MKTYSGNIVLVAFSLAVLAAMLNKTSHKSGKKLFGHFCVLYIDCYERICLYTANF